MMMRLRELADAQHDEAMVRRDRGRFGGDRQIAERERLRVGERDVADAELIRELQDREGPCFVQTFDLRLCARLQLVGRSVLDVEPEQLELVRDRWLAAD